MNGVVAMDDVDLNAEKNLGSIDFAGTPPTSYKKKIDLPQNSMTTKIKEIGNSTVLHKFSFKHVPKKQVVQSFVDIFSCALSAV